MRGQYLDSIKIPTGAQFILDSLENAGYAAYCVGGCVRDSLRGVEPHDWDIATAATPEAMKCVFHGQKIVETGLKHGTITVFVDKNQYEVTTFRNDGIYSDGRRPDSVEFVDDVLQDLSRRDFTINAMAYSPKRGLRDPFDGWADLQAQVIRCVRDPYLRFAEDGLRIMRAMRFASTFGFRIDPFTANAMHVHKNLLDRISKERINAELTRMLLGVRIKDILIEFGDIMAQIIPEIEPCIGFEQKNPYHYLQVWEHTALATSLVADGVVMRLSMLLHDIGKPKSFVIGDDGIGHYYGHPEVSAEMAERILRDLRYDSATIDRVVLLIRHHDATLAATPGSVKRWLNRIGESGVYQLLEIKRADAMAQVNPEKKLALLDAFHQVADNVIHFEECFSISHLEINGHDVIGLGVQAGPRVGELLRMCVDAVMDGDVLNDHDHLISYLKNVV